MTPREDRAVRVLRRAVRGRRLSRQQAAVLDRLLSVVANEAAALLMWVAPGRPRAGGPSTQPTPLVGHGTRPGHPGWWAQGEPGGGCHSPKRANDGTVEWAHGRSVYVEHLDGAADVFLVRMDALCPPDGEPDVTEAIVLTANGSFTARQAEAYALAVLAAVRRLDAGLPGTPGGLPAGAHRDGSAA